jgi:hypothetical protein
MFLGQGLSLFLQTAYFSIIIRSLSAKQYGAFAAAVAVPPILASFVGLGIGNLLVKNGSQNRELFLAYWGRSLFIALASKIGKSRLEPVAGAGGPRKAILGHQNKVPTAKTQRVQCLQSSRLTVPITKLLAESA